MESPDSHQEADLWDFDSLVPDRGTPRQFHAVPGCAPDVCAPFHQKITGEMLRLALGTGDISNLSLCRHMVIYVFSHEAESTLGDSLLHLKPITVK